MNDALVTFIYVGDLVRAEAFYGDTLGLTMVTKQPTCRIYQVSSTGYLGVCTGDRAVTPAGVVITLVRDDVDEFCATLEAAGVKLESGPEHSDRFGIYHAFLRDPDGYLIEIQRFDDPSWNQPDVDVGVDGDGQEMY